MKRLLLSLAFALFALPALAEVRTFDWLELIPEDPDEQAALRASVEDRAAREEAAHRQPAQDGVAQDDAAQDGAGHDPEDRAAGHTPTPLRPERLSRGFMRGFTTNMLNPKVGVFYLAMIPQFMAVGVPAWLMGLSLAGIHVAMTLVFFALRAALGSRDDG